ncbi:hypothetical protein [Burkholderia ubonensis]|uniref:hypothetical protein n=1 Tax=Burkholderia ubonensis TaxID=101571 RepID=UPI00075D9C09|nr:hypothetical protein [Burkholderia ubonensis]KVO15121.1 hypothetical protein WJ74_10730 [Burkholderia ubonensis]KVT01154.1 hypothetical protein WK47_25100 [Burkholderia ubonensis]KVT07413.1 hypothetical protein WK46_10805 [Burkholderia ubonensis]KVT33810.1 hypothetical protein WK50_02480 [Burkholderia ubonensis]
MSLEQRDEASSQEEGLVLPQHAVSTVVRERAQRLFHPGGYEITGYVLTQKISSWKAVIDVTGTRSMSAADLERLMRWEEPTGSGGPPERDADDGPPPVPLSPATTAVPKCALSHEPSHAVPKDIADALGVLAKRLGCCYNDSIPHNAGWFVPGKPIAYVSALDAIEALFESLRRGGTTYEPAKRADPTRAGGAPLMQATCDLFQQALF